MKFTFGQNWRDFSLHLDVDRVRAAEQSLARLLAREDLSGMSFVDVGAGSGLFSIAALRLGASRAVAIDVDEQCLAVACQNAERFLPAERRSAFVIRRGNALDATTLGDDAFDVVYAWGSLHHTGAMWTAIENAARLCAPGGRFALAIYNRTWLSPGWLRIKRLYHAAPRPVAALMALGLSATRGAVRVLRRRHPWKTERGMSTWYDAVDWLGGLPYEYATCDDVVSFLGRRGFRPISVWPTRRSGCNEFVFEKPF